MKKATLLFFIAALALGTVKAQDGNNICVWNALQSYDQGGGTSELESAMKCSDEAAANESTSGKWKTWFYRGELYTKVYLDTTLRNKYGNAPTEAVKAFKKLSDLNDPKFKQWDEVGNYYPSLLVNLYNEGATEYNNKNYVQAYSTFGSMKDLMAVADAHNMKLPPNVKVDLSEILKFRAISAENTGNMENAAAAYADWIQVAPTSMAYYRLGDMYKQAKQKDKAKATLEEGLVKFPKDANLLVQKINFFLEDSNYTAALGYVNNLLEVEPNNDGALFIKGQAYDKIGNEDSVVYYYEKATQVNPKNRLAWNNLGAVYVNKANAMKEKMNALGSTPDDTKKFNEMKKVQKELYLKGKPYLEKALELDPSDAMIKRTLQQIDAYTGGQ